MADPIPSLSPTEAQALLDEGWLALDVRVDSEREESHIPGSVHITLTELSSRAGELNREDKLLVYCHRGSRAAMAAQALQGAGYTVSTLDGGILAWREANLPLESTGK